MEGNLPAILVLVVVIALAVWFFFVRPSRRNQVGTTSSAEPAPDEQLDTGEVVESSEETSPEEDTVEEPDKTWQEHEKDGDTAFAEFRYDDAVASYDEALNGARDEFGRDAIELADLLLKIGRAYQARDDGFEDEDYFSAYYRRALAIVGQKLGHKHPRLLPVLTHLIAALDQAGEHGNAVALAHRYRRVQSLDKSASAGAADTSEAESLFDSSIRCSGLAWLST